MSREFQNQIEIFPVGAWVLGRTPRELDAEDEEEEYKRQPSHEMATAADAAAFLPHTAKKSTQLSLETQIAIRTSLSALLGKKIRIRSARLLDARQAPRP